MVGLVCDWNRLTVMHTCGNVTVKFSIYRRSPDKTSLNGGKKNPTVLHLILKHGNLYTRRQEIKVGFDMISHGVSSQQ